MLIDGFNTLRTYSITVRSIIPLPDPSVETDHSSHPPNSPIFPKGSQVLALYPDTTAFYRATVVAAPVIGNTLSLGSKSGNGKPDPGAKRDKYRLRFIDDEDQVQDVHKDFVVLVSFSNQVSDLTYERTVPFLMPEKGKTVMPAVHRSSRMLRTSQSRGINFIMLCQLRNGIPF